MHDMHRPEETLRQIARLLAPYVAEELEKPRPSLSPEYDEATSEVYVAPLSTDVLRRAYGFFGALQMHGRMNSVDLASILGVDSPRQISGLLTTPLKRRARQLELPLPFIGGEGSLPYGGIPEPDPARDDPGRTYWEDRNGASARLVTAIREELARRGAWKANKFVWEPGDFEILPEEEVAELGLQFNDLKLHERRDPS
jgi:hypothetical protein